jgi:hypothetical protein
LHAPNGSKPGNERFRSMSLAGNRSLLTRELIPGAKRPWRKKGQPVMKLNFLPETWDKGIQ